MAGKAGRGAKPQPENAALQGGKNRVLQEQLIARIERTGGATATRRAMQSTASTFCKWLAKEGIRPNKPDEIHPKRIYAYVRAQLDAGKDPGTIKNKMGHLRQIIPKAFIANKDGREHAITNEKLGIPERSREGTKRAISPAEFRERLERVADPAVRTAMQLEYEIGLRGLEAIRCSPWLKEWKRDLDAGSNYLYVSAGTKGGRSRTVDITTNREAVRAAVESALKLVDKDGFLVKPPPPRAFAAPERVNRSASQPLRRAQSYYAREVRKAGFVGELAPHSARYAFAGRKIEAHVAAGMPRHLAARLVSQDLGHGDGRGRYVHNTYNRRR